LFFVSDGKELPKNLTPFVMALEVVMFLGYRSDQCCAVVPPFIHTSDQLVVK